MTVRESQGQAEEAILQIILTIDHVAPFFVSLSPSLPMMSLSVISNQ